VTKRTPTDISASVHQLLLNRAHQTSRPFNEVLQYYAMERFLYRLSNSPHADKFVLKGALMFAAWRLRDYRPTMDIDLLGKTKNQVNSIVAIMKEVCAQHVEPDGIAFDLATIQGTRIAEQANYQDRIDPLKESPASILDRKGEVEPRTSITTDTRNQIPRSASRSQYGESSEDWWPNLISAA